MSGIGLWHVGDIVPLVVRYHLNGAEVTTGTATIRIWRRNGSDIEYLQSNETSFSTTAHDFSATYVSGIGFLKSITIPSSMENYAITWQLTHSDTALPSYSEQNRTVKDSSWSDLEIQLGA